MELDEENPGGTMGIPFPPLMAHKLAPTFCLLQDLKQIVLPKSKMNEDPQGSVIYMGKCNLQTLL